MASSPWEHAELDASDDVTIPRWRGVSRPSRRTQIYLASCPEPDAVTVRWNNGQAEAARVSCAPPPPSHAAPPRGMDPGGLGQTVCIPGTHRTPAEALAPEAFADGHTLRLDLRERIARSPFVPVAMWQRLLFSPNVEEVVESARPARDPRAPPAHAPEPPRESEDSSYSSWFRRGQSGSISTPLEPAGGVISARWTWIVSIALVSLGLMFAVGWLALVLGVAQSWRS